MSATRGGAVAAALVLVASGASADVEDVLNGRYRGSVAVVLVPLQSDCGGFYTDNELIGSQVRSGGDRRFAAGELVRVERVAVKRGRIDLFVDLAEPVLWPLRDGPFTLYEERQCRAQLQVPQPREALADAGRAGEALALLVERHPARAEAEAAPSWNGRRREAYPEDYDRTLAEHAAWKASQINATVQERLDEATAEARRVADRLDDDPDYLQGFAAGVREARDRYLTNDCAELVGQRAEGLLRSSPSGNGEDWRRGHQDGQRLVYNLELLRRLPRCFVPVPPPS